jgi:hypothetical protein
MSSDNSYEMITRDFTVEAKVNIHADVHYSDEQLDSLVREYIEENPDHHSEETLWEINELWQNNRSVDDMDLDLAQQIFVDFAKASMTNRILLDMKEHAPFLTVENILFDYDDFSQITDYGDIECVIQTKIYALARIDDEKAMDLYAADDTNKRLTVERYVFDDSDCKCTLEDSLHNVLDDEQEKYLCVSDEAIENGIHHLLYYVLEYETDRILTKMIQGDLEFKMIDLSFTEHEKDWLEIWKLVNEVNKDQSGVTDWEG